MSAAEVLRQAADRLDRPQTSLTLDGMNVDPGPIVGLLRHLAGLLRDDDQVVDADTTIGNAVSVARVMLGVSA
jgi:hypothetical protein